MYKLDKNEEIFYKDYQSSTRKFRISEEIDNEQEIEVCKELELSKDIDDKEQEEEYFIFDNSFAKVINTSVGVSPDDKKITCGRGVQVFIPFHSKYNCYCELQIRNISSKSSSCFAGSMRNFV